MRKCPRCKIPLFRTQYCTINLLQCGKCQGNLVSLDRLNRLAATREKSISDLMEKWRSYPPVDPLLRARCPECRTMMEKHAQRGGVRFDHHTCWNCHILWLDPGDLEIYLLAYVVSDKGKEAQKFKDIHSHMSDFEKAKLKTLIDALPEDPAESPDNFLNPYN